MCSERPQQKSCTFANSEPLANPARPIRPTIPALLAALPLWLLAGCATPVKVLDTLDRSRESVSQTMAQIVDQADQMFGEPRVEDKLRMVQLKFGPEFEWVEDEGIDIGFPIRFRAPLPALERKANVFLEFDSWSDTSDTADVAATSFDQNKSFTATFLSTVSEKVNLGMRFNIYWSSGPQLAVKPFIRWERSLDPFHVFLEEEVYYKTDNGFGTKTTAQIDRKLVRESFLRFVVSAEYYQELYGVDFTPVLIYRRPLIGWSYLSAELGVNFNPHQGPTGKGVVNDPNEPLGEQDEDRAFAYLRWRGKFPKYTWIEYEVRPELFFPWNHDNYIQYGVLLSITLVYAAYLR